MGGQSCRAAVKGLNAKKGVTRLIQQVKSIAVTGEADGCNTGRVDTIKAPGDCGLRIRPKFRSGAFDHSGGGLERGAVDSVSRHLTSSEIKQNRLYDRVAYVDTKKKVRRHDCRPPRRPCRQRLGG
jgi:hypothetical protein